VAEEKMKSRRAQLESKLQTLVVNRDELFHLLWPEQQHQQPVTSYFLKHPGSSTSDSAAVGQLINIADNTIETVGALLSIGSSDQLQDGISTLLDLVSLLVTLNYPMCRSKHAYSATAVADNWTRPCCDFVVACLIAFCILAIWLVEIWSAMSAVG